MYGIAIIVNLCIIKFKLNIHTTFNLDILSSTVSQFHHLFR